MKDPLQPHSHDNNTKPPHTDPSILLILPTLELITLTLDDLRALPRTQFAYEYTTDHGKHGPYQLEGVTLADLMGRYWPGPFVSVEVMSADQFGNRLFPDELMGGKHNPPLLCDMSDGESLTRENGLVRLVVPSEIDNALRQVKWVATIRIVR